MNAQNKSMQLDSLFNYYSNNGSFSGVVLAAENGKVIFNKMYGFSDYENKRPMDSSGAFNIASITKPFTALALMMLKEKGKLSYEDKLLKYLPDFPTYAKDITIRHLLTHSSGIKDYANELHLSRVLNVLTTKIVYDSLIHQPRLNMKPGEKYSYSNSGYFLLALIIEKVSGMSYKEFIEKEVFRPLGMYHSYVLTETDTVIPNRVNGYYGNWQKDMDDLNCRVPGDGNIYTTASDFFLFTQALDNYSIVSKKTLEEAYDTSSAKSIRKGIKYGFGWIIQNDSTGTIVSHNGGLGGFRCQLWRNLKKHNTLIVLCNTTFLAECSGILPAAQNIMNDKPYSLGKIPITELFYEKISQRGFQAAMRAIRKEKANANSIYSFPEMIINNLGLDFLLQKKPLFAIEVLKLNVELYPESWNAWDSLAEAYFATGNYNFSVDADKKSLQLNPENKYAKERLNKLKSNK
jgi:CubicO group peptidase (beta-lactamase class C family)